MIIHNFTNKDFNYKDTRTGPCEDIDFEAYPEAAEELNAVNYIYIKKLIAVAKAAKKQYDENRGYLELGKALKELEKE